MGLNAAIRDLGQLFRGAVRTNVLLREVTRWRVGGPADAIVSPRSVEELAQLRAWIYERQVPSIVIGATSNLLFSDEGLRAIAIHIGPKLAALTISDGLISAGPGVWVPGLARSAMLAGLTGIEHTCGIPGTLGGLVYMNGGSQRRGIGEHVLAVRTVCPSGKIRTRDQKACGFAYRSSAFQGVDEVISGVDLLLPPVADRKAQRKEMLGILRDRRMKFPKKLPNCGSVFVSNPAMYASYGPPGKVIEQAGFKGRRVGGMQVSDMHANFIVNLGEGRATEALELINQIRSKVKQNTGYEMAVEVRYVTPSGDVKQI